MERNKFWIGVAIIAAIVVFAVALRGQRSPDPQGEGARLGIKWEYKRVVNPSEEEMNKLGVDGWELVAVTGGEAHVKSSVTQPNPMGQGTATQNTIDYGKPTCIFKRLVYVK